MRARNIKPGFFKNDKLSELPPLVRILFAGLWCIADREGRLDDRPKRIKAEVLPYDDFDVDAGLELLNGEFINRYSIDGNAYIEIIHFLDHQNPHKAERQSCIPPYQHSTSTVQVQNKNSSNIADSLIPDSLIPDSLIPDSLIPDSPRARERDDPPQPLDDHSHMTLSDALGWYCRTFAIQMPAQINAINREKLAQIITQYPRDKLEAAFEATARGNGRTIDYLLAVLDEKGKCRGGRNQKTGGNGSGDKIDWKGDMRGIDGDDFPDWARDIPD